MEAQQPGGRSGGAIGRYIDDHAADVTESLSAWVSIPSVAADPRRRMDVVRSAHWIAGEMRDAGMQTSLIPAGESIDVFGESIVDPMAPIVLVYSHHDVRDAKPEEWSETEPFTPVLRDGRLYGRGASDAKGQVLAHLWGLRAHRETTGQGRGITVKVLVDGEEEIGSPHLQQILRDDPDRFACDLIVFSDTIQWRRDAPAAVTSMRGTLTATLKVFGPVRDVHSGVASGAAPNPALALAHVLAELHDDHGRVAVPGFYDAVAPISPQRKAEFDALPLDLRAWIDRTETRAVVGEEGHTLPERLWARPALEVISLLAGDPEGLERSVIPREATASLSIRTVPDQRLPVVADQLRAFVASRMPPGVEFELTVDESIGQEPYTSPSGPVLEALERALTLGYGMPVNGRMGNAGGGPAEWLSRALDAPVYFLGTGLPEDHWHASDESVDIGMLLHGAATIAHLWREIDAVPRAKRRSRPGDDPDGASRRDTLDEADPAARLARTGDDALHLTPTARGDSRR